MTPPTPAELDRFRRFLGQHIGLDQWDSPAFELETVLRERMHATHLPRPGSYLDYLETPRHAEEELYALAERLTVGETSFFRHAEQFDAFVTDALPNLAPAGRRTPIRLLSAGCASGEEPYTLAIMLQERARTHGPLAVELLGIDINGNFLAKARAGVYSRWALRNTPPAIVARYFHRVGNRFALNDEVKQRVSFTQRNLLLDDPGFWAPGRFDAIFCRNVLIYFSEQAIHLLLERFAYSLSPCGYLFLGHAESLGASPADFQVRQAPHAFYYRRTGVACAPGLPPPPQPPVLGLHPLPPPARPTRAPVPSPLPVATQTLAMPPGIYHLGLGTIQDLLRQERFDEALALWQALPAPARAQADTHLLHAVLLVHKGQTTAAEAVCQHVLALDPRNAGAYYLMAICREQASDPAGAMAHDRTASHLDPTFAMPHLHLGRLARRLGDPALARVHLHQALQLLPFSPIARLDLFGGGFSRSTLIEMCRAELRSVGEAS